MMQKKMRQNTHLSEGLPKPFQFVRQTEKAFSIQSIYMINVTSSTLMPLSYPLLLSCNLKHNIFIYRAL